jgi:steroid delta-isomerase-like uncharacterized protein
MATNTTSPADTARAVFDAFNAHDPARMRELWTEDVSERMPDGTVTGAAALVDYFTGLFTGIPDARMEIVALAEQGEEVFVRWRMTGTHTGLFQGIRPTGKAVDLAGFDQMTIRDGKLARNFVVFDRQQVAQQLGLLPPDGSGAERGMKAFFNLKTRIARRGPATG